MREATIQCPDPHGTHTLAYVEWGVGDNSRVLFCVHGLTRNCRDFDFLAQAMADKYRVICPDVVGRGRSGWLANAADYDFPVYAADMRALIAHLGVERVDWVGTSMGGLIGMLIASQTPAAIGRLVLNDVGPVITAQALHRIAKYTGVAPEFDDVAAAEAYIRLVSAPFGALSDAQWRHLTVHEIRQRADGKYELNYDPAIAQSFRLAAATEKDIDLWPIYEAIQCPTLVIHGAESDLLPRETVFEMERRGPRARTVEIAGVGHAPTLMDEAQIGYVRDFLLGT